MSGRAPTDCLCGSPALAWLAALLLLTGVPLAASAQQGETDEGGDDAAWDEAETESEGIEDLEALEDLELRWLEGLGWTRPDSALVEGPYEGLQDEGISLGIMTIVEVPHADLHPLVPRDEPPEAERPAEGDEANEAEGLPPLTRFDLTGIRPMFGLDSLDHDQIQAYLRFYTTDGRRRMARLLARSGRYGDFIRSELREAGLPEELVYLVMIESGFDPTARSRAGAVGLWQFMSRTGRAYGLDVGRRYDERRDPVRSTEAAIAYLESLHERFESWPLAMAAYNAGLGHVRGEMRRYNLNDFWSMDAYSAIYDATRRYVYKIVAAAIIGEYPERFGFGGVVREDPVRTETVDVPGRTSLRVFARAAGTDVETLRELNPALGVSATPDVESYPLNIPIGTLDHFLAEYDGYVPDEVGQVTLHRLRFGETLDQVAAQVDLPERVLRAANGLDRDEEPAYGTELAIPLAPEVAEPALSAGPGPPPDDPPVVVVPALRFHYPDRSRVFYDVQGDDDLRAVAQAFHVSVPDLAMWNDLDPDAALVSGMTLQVFVEPGADLSDVRYLPESHVRPLPLGSAEYQAWDEAEERARRARRRTYTVRRGDTVSTIARRFGVSSRDIIRWNDLDNPNHIRAGQVLRVR